MSFANYPNPSDLDQCRGSQKLIYILKLEGIRQKELADFSKISKGTINRLCKGKQKVSLTTQSKIIKTLNKLSGKSYKIEDLFN